jgi:uncharacterized protein YodC (DUF2158 family)
MVVVLRREPLKVGDAVNLKCGGALMTVSKVGVGGLSDKVRCQWFLDGVLRDGDFDPASLQLWVRG